MERQVIEVEAGNFWQQFDELGDKTYMQTLLLDEPLVKQLEASANRKEQFDEYGLLLTWNTVQVNLIRPDVVPKPQRSIFLIYEKNREGNSHYRVLFISTSSPIKVGFHYQVVTTEQEFYFKLK